MATTEDRSAESLDAWRAGSYEKAPERTDELFSSGIGTLALASLYDEQVEARFADKRFFVRCDLCASRNAR